MTMRSKFSLVSTIAAMAVMAGISLAASPMEQALLTPQSEAHEQIIQARDSVAGAQDDLADARAYLAELESGQFANIYVVDDDGSLRCGEPAANPGCAPLTEKDKRDSLAEARSFLEQAQAQLSDAKTELARLEGGVKSAGVETISSNQ